jgi:hypothetical protein
VNCVLALIFLFTCAGLHRLCRLELSVTELGHVVHKGVRLHEVP